jgi:transcriptional regulator of heat shock response
MYDLTPRQVDILKLIVREYIDNAEAVGSETLLLLALKYQPALELDHF